MKTTISVYDFRDAFIKADRKAQFSYDGLEILFEYLTDFEDATGEEMELDVIAICCDFSEEMPDEIARNYSLDIKGLDDDETAEKVREYLEEEGCYIGTTDLGAIIYRQH